MSSRGAPPRGRGRGDRGGDRGRGFDGNRGGRGRGRGGSMDLPFREGGPTRGGDVRGRGRGRGSDSERGGRGRGSFRGGPRGGGYQGPPIYSPSGQLQPPDQEVQKLENAVVAAVGKKDRKPTSYPERPGYGTRGNAVTLFANYFKLSSIWKQLLSYHIDIEPGASEARKPKGKKAKQIVSLLIEEHFAAVQKHVVTDYRSTLISNIPVLPSDQQEATYDVRYRDEQSDEYPEQPQVYRVKCQFTRTLTPGQLLAYLTETESECFFDSKTEILQAMNIVLGYHAKSAQAIASVGANKHFAIRGPTVEKLDLGAGIEAYRGFFVSVRAATARLLVNVQVKYIACYQEGPLGHVIREFQRTNRHPSKLRSFLSRLRIRVMHIERKNSKGKVVPRMKTITGLAAPGDGRGNASPPKVKYYGAGPNDVEFFLESPGQPTQQSSGGGGKKGKKPAKAGPAPAGKYISIADFFRQQYGVNVNPDMPVINTSTRENPSYLPVEVCMVEPGQPAKAKLSPLQTRNMMNFAVRLPPQNAQSIVSNGTEVLGLAPPNPSLVEYGMGIDSQLITVPGRVLPVPRILYKDAKKKPKTVTPRFGSWNMMSIQFERATKLASWTWLLLNVEGPRTYFEGPAALNAPLKAFTDKLNEIGVGASPPKQGMRVCLDPSKNLEAQIDTAISKLVSTTKPTLILGILPYNSAEIYNSVKRACDLTHGVININVLAERFREANEQYIANVGLKFNLKLGGANQVLPPNELDIISQGRTMLVGIDVTHPSPGSSDSAPSVAGMVASMDPTLAQWPAELRIQAARQEMVADLDGMLKAHLARWARSHKNAPYPENLIVYRDGVSEGQYQIVLEKELPLLRKACKEVYPASDTSKSLPRISIICVGKRHHTRFYPTRKEDADRSMNPSNGTVVDRGVTEARNWDFYLQAHTALKGTARPAHYFTLWDEIFALQKPAPPHQNAADVLEALTHHLCYLFGRATKAVSICPPAYYADLVCTRARGYLSSLYDASSAESSAPGSGGPKLDTMNVTVHPNVRDTMFYI